jgi:hypothetical protein
VLCPVQPERTVTYLADVAHEVAIEGVDELSTG